MDPIIFHLGCVSVTWYGVMLATGFLAGLVNWAKLGRDRGKDFDFCSDMLFWIIISGIVGARITYILSDLETYIKEPVRMFRVWEGGLVYYGGFAGSAIALIVFSIKKKMHLLDLLDFVITGVPLGHFFGRIGCYINGCCYGFPWNGPLAKTYPMDTIPWDAQVREGLITRFECAHPVFPIQLLEAFYNLVIYAIVLFVFKKTKTRGHTLATYLLLYPVGRFFLEFLRGDEKVLFHGYSSAQWVSIVLFMLGIVLLVMSRKQDADTEIKIDSAKK